MEQITGQLYRVSSSLKTKIKKLYATFNDNYTLDNNNVVIAPPPDQTWHTIDYYYIFIPNDFDIHSFDNFLNEKDYELVEGCPTLGESFSANKLVVWRATGDYNSANGLTSDGPTLIVTDDYVGAKDARWPIDNNAGRVIRICGVSLDLARRIYNDLIDLFTLCDKFTSNLFSTNDDYILKWNTHKSYENNLEDVRKLLCVYIHRQLEDVGLDSMISVIDTFRNVPNSIPKLTHDEKSNLFKKKNIVMW